VIQTAAPPTLDGLFRRLLARQPGALALVDPPDKPRVSGQPPQRLSFAQADRAIAALAAHFVEAGLPANSVIAVQLPNTIEFVLTVLAAHRAGLVVALLPQLWRQAELTVALNRIGARAIVTMSRIDGVSHADLAMNAAVEAFSIRHVCGFGSDLPEGMACLDDVMANAPAVAPSATQDGHRAAIISFDVTTEGFRAVPRTHLHLIAGGLAVFLESGVPQGATILSAFAPSSFAGLTSSLVIWLLSGGALILHHPFDAEVLEQQIGQACDVLVAPAPLALRFAEAGMLSQALRHVIGLWRAPEQVASSPEWPARQAELTDVYLFGEAGLLAACRAEDGGPVPILPGPQRAPRNAEDASITGEILLTPKATLALRGPMIPVAAYAASALSSGSAAAQPPLDHIDTG
jgi:acyl-CoA synthetase (AMP-forming)/AMP-acid ligase II